MRRLFASLALCATILATGATLAPRVVPLGFSAVALTGCLEDECDKIRNDCRDKGLVPVNCKEEKTAISDKCQCECVSPESQN